MSGFEKWAAQWNKNPRRNTIGKKFREFVSPPGPIKQQIISAVYKITNQINRLDYSMAKLQSYDKQLFEKTVNSLIEGDKTKAAMFAGELAEIRKMAKIILTVRYALEKVKIRLETAVIVGDMHANLAPAVVALKQVAGYLKGMMPDVFTELMEVDETLQLTMMQTVAAVPDMLNTNVVSEEAAKILKDASLVAEQRIKQQFPDIPSLDSVSAPTGGLAGATVEEK
ncbi:MAG: Snf7 family protein [Desulfurococcales archaeon]|nr:Snf7 family protein [Desulfurococcales archaeon]